MTKVTNGFCSSLADTLLATHDLFSPLPLSWLPSIALTSVLIRATLFPFKVIHQANLVNMQEAQLEFAQRVAPLIQREVFDNEKMRQAKKQQELTRLFWKYNVSLFRMLIPMAVNVPVFLGMTRVLRALEYGAEMGWLANGDWRVTLATCVCNAVVLQASRKFLMPVQSANGLQQVANRSTIQKLLLPGLHVLNAASFFILKGMPAATNFYFMLSGMIALAENVAVRSGLLMRFMRRARMIGCPNTSEKSLSISK